MSENASDTSSLRRNLLWGILAAVMLAVAFTALMAPRWARPPVGRPPMVMGQVPEFSLTNRDGEVLTHTVLLGSPWVADFIFTRCALNCPRMTQRMLQLEKLWAAGLEVARVSFSVDPEYDTPEILQGYADSWGIDDPRWYFLTGARETMKSIVMDGFKLAVEMNPPPGTASPEEPILHSTRFVLVDAAGAIRGYYEVVEGGELERLARDLRALQAEN